MSKQPKFQTLYNRDAFKQRGKEKRTKPGLTIPDQSMTVLELKERYVRGLPLGGQRVPVYRGEEDDFPDLARMDISERAEYAEQLAEKIKAMKDDLMEQEKKKKIIEDEKVFHAKLKDYLKKNPPPAEKGGSNEA